MHRRLLTPRVVHITECCGLSNDHGPTTHGLCLTASFWFNTISILLCEGPKPNISMISGFLRPGEPLFMDLNILKYFRNIRTILVFLKHMIFVNLGILTVYVVGNLCADFWNFGISIFENSKVAVWHLKIWKFETWYLEIWKLISGKWNFGNSKIWNWKLENLKI